MKKILEGVATAALAALLIPAQVLAEPTNAFQGHELYDTYCFICHGEDGKGKGPLASKMPSKPANLTTSKRSSKELFDIVKGTDKHNINGVMPEWGRLLSDPQIDSLVAYLRFLGNTSEVLPGDPHRGRKIYSRYCSACHGIHGRGDGVMVGVLPMKPADHTQTGAVATMSNTKLLGIIAEGKGVYMPGWAETLTEEEMAAVASYIRLMSH
ncbi:MAG: c-type cytochrome [Chromatiales bacterium]|nr:c-type cytochrome [Chromatiales bacterium]